MVDSWPVLNLYTIPCDQPFAEVFWKELINF